MMRLWFLLIVVFVCKFELYAEFNKDSLTRELNRVLDNKSEYVLEKQNKILHLKGLLRIGNLSECELAVTCPDRGGKQRVGLHDASDGAFDLAPAGRASSF